jgi:hypothetical protein
MPRDLMNSLSPIIGSAIGKHFDRLIEQRADRIRLDGNRLSQEYVRAELYDALQASAATKEDQS